LRKGQRRGTLEECRAKNQLRYYGIEQVPLEYIGKIIEERNAKRKEKSKLRREEKKRKMAEMPKEKKEAPPTKKEEEQEEMPTTSKEPAQHAIKREDVQTPAKMPPLGRAFLQGYNDFLKSMSASYDKAIQQKDYKRVEDTHNIINEVKAWRGRYLYTFETITTQKAINMLKLYDKEAIKLSGAKKKATERGKRNIDILTRFFATERDRMKPLVLREKKREESMPSTSGTR